MTAAPGLTVTLSFRNPEFVPNLLACPSYAGVKISETLFNTLPLEHEPGEIRPRDILRKFVNGLARFLVAMRRVFHISYLLGILPHE